MKVHKTKSGGMSYINRQRIVLNEGGMGWCLSLGRFGDSFMLFIGLPNGSNFCKLWIIRKWKCNG